MKKLIILLVVSMIFIWSTDELKAQNINDPFLGIWQWQDGIKTFKVQLYLDEDGDVGGHFEMVQTSTNGIVTVLYKSNKDIGSDLTWGRVIYGSSNGSVLSAGIDDNTIINPNFSLLMGQLEMTLQSNIGPGLPTATWKVKRRSGTRLDNDNRVFNIPTDIVLTKIN